MIDTSIISLISIIISTIVGIIQLLSYLNNKNHTKESSMEKFAKAANINSELETIRNDIKQNASKLDDHSTQISELKTENAVCASERSRTNEDILYQIRLLEKLDDKLDDLWEK